MDPISDLPPITGEHAAIAGDLSPAMPTNHLHPPYAEMIKAAITALKDRDGSSRQAISKYIEKEYNNLPPTHSVLLTHHLKRMKNQGQLIMVKHSYMLPPPRSVPFQPTVYHPTLDFSATATDATATTASVNNPEGLSKRKPGRPPKLRPDSGFGAQAQVQVQPQMQNLQLYDAAASADVQPYEPQFQYQLGVGQAFHTQSHYGSGTDNSAGGAEPLFASLGLGDDGVAAPSSPPAENTTVAAKRGRGRPPKVAGVAVSGGGGGGVDKLPVRRPKLMSVMMGANGGRVKRGRGRPKRIGIGPVTVPLSGNVLRPRGRPKRAASRSIAAVHGGVGEGGLGSRRRGRPSKSGGVKLTGKSFGSPSKVGPGTAVLVTDPQQLVAYQELKNKYELLQSKVKQVANVVKSCIDPNYGAAALGALHELEAMAGTQEPTPFIHN